MADIGDEGTISSAVPDYGGFNCVVIAKAWIAETELLIVRVNLPVAPKTFMLSANFFIKERPRILPQLVPGSWDELAKCGWTPEGAK